MAMSVKTLRRLRCLELLLRRAPATVPMVFGRCLRKIYKEVEVF